MKRVESYRFVLVQFVLAMVHGVHESVRYFATRKKLFQAISISHLDVLMVSKNGQAVTKKFCYE